MSEKYTGGQAFPLAIGVSSVGDQYQGQDGMTLRDWFAGQAAPVLMVNCIETIDLDRDGVAKAAAKAAYILADAMLVERGK